MTDEDRRSGVAISGQMESTDGMLRQAGRDFLLHIYATLRSLKLYPVENEQVQRSLDDLHKSALNLLGIEDQLEVRISGEFIFVNSTRLRLSLDNYASFSHVLNTLARGRARTVTRTATISEPYSQRRFFLDRHLPSRIS